MAISDEKRKELHLMLDYLINEVERFKVSGESGIRLLANNGGICGARVVWDHTVRFEEKK